MGFSKNRTAQLSESARLVCGKIILAISCLILLNCVGCGYPEVSPKTYEISKTLYSVCSLKQEQNLTRVADVISQACDAQEVSASECAWLMDIVEQAQNGQWESATSEVRRILEDQTGR